MSFDRIVIIGRGLMRGDIEGYRRSSGLVDVLDRVLDKGLVVAGDIRVSLAEVELLTIRVRLLVCSIDKAQQIGLDWWRWEPNLSGKAKALADENDSLRADVQRLQDRLAALEAGRPAPRRRRSPGEGSTR